MDKEKKEKSFFEMAQEEFRLKLKDCINGMERNKDIKFEVGLSDLAQMAIAEELHKFNENLEKLTTMDGSAIRMQLKNRE